MNAALEPTTGFDQPVEAAIVERAQRGEMEAFAELYRRYGRACFQLAMRLLGQRTQAEDLVQEVFLKVMDTIDKYRGEAPFGAWLKRMTVNACIDQLRRLRFRADEEPEAVFTQTAAATVDAGPVLDVWGLLARLSPRARAIVVLHELEGYTHAELAALFGQSESYSKSILSRALKRLHALVAVHPVSEGTPCAKTN
jgi:RNA polymerase sigma-70 factor (ECF subfamily)